MGSISVIRKPPHAKTFGMEIEAYPLQGSWYEGTRCGFWEGTSDASIGYTGLEWLCQPMPYNMMIKQINRLHAKLGGWKVDHQCGLHIHVSRQYWPSHRESKFSKFLKTLTRVQLTELFGRYSSQYANPNTYTGDKFRAINLLHDVTYEFRLWAAGDLVWTFEIINSPMCRGERIMCSLPCMCRFNAVKSARRLLCHSFAPLPLALHSFVLLPLQFRPERSIIRRPPGFLVVLYTMPPSVATCSAWCENTISDPISCRPTPVSA